MPISTKSQDFFNTPEGLEIKIALESISSDKNYMTKSSYSPDTAKYKNNLMPFIDKHMIYIYTHPQINPMQYIANLKLITRKK